MALNDESTLRRLLLFVVLAIVAGGATDLALDAPDRWLSAHVLFELGMIAAALSIALWLGSGWITAERARTAAANSLARGLEERDAWRDSARAAVEGFGRAIDEQFGRWELTPAEREVALLLLQGRSHKEIAALTDRSERTVRQHAVAVYQKSGLRGRAELAAFFLGDLLPSPATVRG